MGGRSVPVADGGGQVVKGAGMAATPLACRWMVGNSDSERWPVSLTRAKPSQGRRLRAGSRDALPAGGVV